MTGLPPHGPSDIYRSHGDRRPEFGPLLNLYNQQRHLPDLPQIYASVAVRNTLVGDLELDMDHIRRMPQTPGSGATRDITLGDMALDIADSNRLQRDQWIARAKSHFRDARDVGQVWLGGDRNRRKITNGRHQIVAAAAIRHTDVALWELAVSDQPIEIDYAELLTSRLNIFKYLSWLRPGVEDNVGEGIPQVVGARSGEAVGRHALSREDDQFPLRIATQAQYAKVGAKQRRNPRWDSSLSRSDDPKEFLEPSRRLQVKPVFRPRPGEAVTASAYLNAGVLPVSTLRMGWPSPRAVIVSCALDEGIEVEGMLNGVDRSLLMSHDQLDDNFGNALNYMLNADIDEAARVVNL